MKQLLLEINADIPPSFDTFVVGKNAELVQLLRLFFQHNPSSFGERAVYLWGEPGSGKTHLLRALANAPQSRYIDATIDGTSDIHFSPDINLYLVDNCQSFDEAGQIDLFNLFNQAKENKAFFVATGSVAPAVLNVRDDLRTRLGWGLIFQLHGLTDAEKMAALEGTAQARGITFPTGVLTYLMNHYHRDMPALSKMVEAIITFSLETKRPITLPLLRELLT